MNISHWLQPFRSQPIGLDWGGRWLKLVQFNADRTQLLDVARIELPESTGELTAEQFAHAWRKVREGRAFRGEEVVICLSEPQLHLQTVRVPKGTLKEMERAIKQEIAPRLPFRLEEAEIRFLEAGDVRQANTTLREVIVAACQKSVVEKIVDLLSAAGVLIAAIDMEPLAMLRGSLAQFRREEDRDVRTLYAHVGYRHTLLMVAEGDSPVLIKYVELGGRDFDQAVAQHLEMELPFAMALRRSMGDRRSERQDPEISAGMREATRSVLERLTNEIGLCLRYHGVTFRGQSLKRLVLGGGEASPALCDELHERLEMECTLSEPFRGITTAPNAARKGQWDVAMGLALKELSA